MVLWELYALCHFAKQCWNQNQNRCRNQGSRQEYRDQANNIGCKLVVTVDLLCIARFRQNQSVSSRWPKEATLHVLGIFQLQGHSLSSACHISSCHAGKGPLLLCYALSVLCASRNNVLECCWFMLHQTHTHKRGCKGCGN